MSSVARSQALLVSLLLVLAASPLPVTIAATDEPAHVETEEAVADAVTVCARLHSDEPLSGLASEVIGQLIVAGEVELEILGADACAPLPSPDAGPAAESIPTPTGPSAEDSAYVEFIAHGAGAAIELARLARRSRTALGLQGLDQAASQLLAWARRHRTWLDRHPPEACYADIHRQWRRGVVHVRDGARDVRRAVRALRPAPMRRAVRGITAGAADLAGVDLQAATQACAAAAISADGG